MSNTLSTAVLAAADPIAAAATMAVGSMKPNAPDKFDKTPSGLEGYQRQVPKGEAGIALQLNLGYVVGRVNQADKLIQLREAGNSPLLSESWISPDLPALTDLRTIEVTRGLKIPTGVVTVLGTSDAAKSPLADFLAKGNVINFGEPLPGDITRAFDACAELIEFLLDPKQQVISFDSVKNLMSRSSGAAGARGISRSVFPMLSDWSAVAASLGKCIVVPVNISTSDVGAMDEIKEAMRSNVTMHIFAAGGASYNFLSRVPGKGRRVAGRFNATFTGSRISSIAVAGSSEEPVSTEVQTSDVGTLDTSIPSSLFKHFQE